MALPPSKFHENLPSDLEVTGGHTETERQTGDLISLL
jgi:hypothetical protein